MAIENTAPSHETAKRLFSYDPNEGVLRWAERKKKRKFGQPAGYINKNNGYTYVGIDGTDYLAHRVIWLLMSGNWPSQLIDHRDGNRSNNKWKNLREATPSQNTVNAKVRVTNTTGVTGVSINHGRFRVRVTVNYREICAGTFDTLEEAAAARNSVAQKYFGEFARM